MGDEAPPSSDFVTHHVRTAVLNGANVTAAQGSFEGPAVLQVLFSTSSWPALTGIHLAVGVSQWINSSSAVHAVPLPQPRPLTLVPMGTDDYTRSRWQRWMWSDPVSQPSKLLRGDDHRLRIRGVRPDPPGRHHSGPSFSLAACKLLKVPLVRAILTACVRPSRVFSGAECFVQATHG